MVNLNSKDLGRCEELYAKLPSVATFNACTLWKTYWKCLWKLLPKMFWYFRCCSTQGAYSIWRGGEGGRECRHCAVGSRSGRSRELNCRPLPAALPHLYQRCSTCLQEHGWTRAPGNRCFLNAFPSVFITKLEIQLSSTSQKIQQHWF